MLFRLKTMPALSMTSLAVTLSFTSSNTPIQSFPDNKKASVFPLMDYKCFLKFHILFSDMHILFFLMFHNLLLFLFQCCLNGNPCLFLKLFLCLNLVFRLIQGRDDIFQKCL